MRRKIAEHPWQASAFDTRIASLSEFAKALREGFASESPMAIEVSVVKSESLVISVT